MFPQAGRRDAATPPRRYHSATRAFQASALLLVSAAALAQQPRIDGLSPSSAPITGGTTVTVRGENLDGATVALDLEPITPLSRTATDIRLSMPKHDGGYAVISVRGPGGVAYAEFLYVPPPLDQLPSGFITTVAGAGTYVRDFGPAVNAMVSPSGLAFGREGALFVAEPGFGKVDRVDPGGIIQRVTRPGSAGLSSGDGGLAIDAFVSFPTSIATDPVGNLYVPDHQYRIRRVDANTGIITTIAGDGQQGFSGDGGPATAARIGVTAYGCVVSGDVFFFIDLDAMRVRRIALGSGIITTVAGSGPGDEGDGGPAVSAKFDVGDSDRGGLAADSRGNLYLGDSKNGRLRRIDALTGIITTVAAAPGIRPVAVDARDDLYYGAGGRIVKLAADGRVLETWGSAGPLTGGPPDGGSAHGPIAGLVTGIAVDASGNVVYSDASAGRVRRIEIATDTIHTLAGIGPAILGEEGPALASVVFPTDLRMESDGSLLFGDSSLRLRRLHADGNISTVAGLGLNGGPNYGPARSVTLAPVGVSPDGAGNVDLADSSVIRQLRRDGQVVPSVSAASGACGYAGDGGPAAEARVCQPWDTTRDAEGNLLVADTNNNRVRRVDARSGVITTIVGNGGRRNGFEGYGNGESCGDGGPAVDACLNTPYGLALDASGNLFISGERGIRRVDAASGVIETFVPDVHVTKLAFGPAGLLYGASFDGRLLRFDAAGRTTAIAGGGSPGDGIGDGGPAANARLRIAHQAAGIAIDRDGNVYVADEGQRRIRAVRHGAVLAPAGATAEAARGSPQSAPLGARYPEPLSVVVRTAGGDPAPSVRVDFACPSSGPSCLFANGLRTISLLTDASGRAAATAVADAAEGGYVATATPLTAAGAAFSLTNTAAPALRLYTLPGAAETPGLGGAFFSSTLTLANLGAGAASIDVSFVPPAGSAPPRDAALSLAPGETRVVPHVLAALFDLLGTAGTLSVSSSAPLSLALRTENVALLPTSGGVYGLGLEPVGSPLSAGETGHAIWATQDASSRTNVAVVLLDPSSEVEVRVFDERGSLRGRTTVAGATPLSWQVPLSTLVSGEMPLARLELSVISGRATGYTVVNDNVTSDAVAAQAERLEEGVTDLLLDGVARAPGLGGTHWSTDVRLFNPGGSPLAVEVDAPGVAGAPRPIGVTVPARGLLQLTDVLGPGGFGLPDGAAGALRLRASGPFLAAARTSNRDPSGQRPGTFSASQRAVPYPGGLVTAPGRGVFAGVDHSDDIPGSRSNLALLSSEGGAAGTLILVDRTGAEISRTPFSLGAGVWTQRSLPGWFGGASTVSTARVDVEVGSGSLHAYVSRIDNATGDAVVVPILAVGR